MTELKTIDAVTAKKWLDNNEAIVVDVREPQEYAAVHIPGATLIPLGIIEKGKLPQLGNKKLIIHCQLGKRGGTACEKLLQSDPALEVYNLEGGIAAWQKEGFLVKKGEEVLSIDQQVQLITGGGVLFGVLAGYFIHGIFFLLPIAIGFGLIYAGITGSCTLSNWLKKMSWNKDK